MGGAKFAAEAGRFTGFARESNNAGGLEGGISNGEDVVVRGYLKPISTLRRPLGSVDFATREPVKAAYERSDVCVVPAAGVAAEAMVALCVARLMVEKFGGDSLGEMRRNSMGTGSRFVSSSCRSRLSFGNDKKVARRGRKLG